MSPEQTDPTYTDEEMSIILKVLSECYRELRVARMPEDVDQPTQAEANTLKLLLRYGVITPETAPEGTEAALEEAVDDI